MPSVHVKYKHKSESCKTFNNGAGSVTVSSKTPTESEVLAALKKKHPNWTDIVILEIN